MQGKIHVVFEGRNPKLYDTWEEANDQVYGFRNALYRSFKTREEAHEAFSKYKRDQLGSSSRVRSNNLNSLNSSSSCE